MTRSTTHNEPSQLPCNIEERSAVDLRRKGCGRAPFHRPASCSEGKPLNPPEAAAARLRQRPAVERLPAGGLHRDVVPSNPQRLALKRPKSNLAQIVDAL